MCYAKCERSSPAYAGFSAPPGRYRNPRVGASFDAGKADHCSGQWARHHVWAVSNSLSPNPAIASGVRAGETWSDPTQPWAIARSGVAFHEGHSTDFLFLTIGTGARTSPAVRGRLLPEPIVWADWPLLHNGGGSCAAVLLDGGVHVPLVNRGGSARCQSFGGGCARRANHL